MSKRRKSETESDMYSEMGNAMHQQPFVLVGEKKSLLLELSQVTGNLTNKKFLQAVTSS